MTVEGVEVTPEQAPAQEPRPRPRAEPRRLRIRIFSSANDAPRARRPTDALLLVATIIGISICTIAAPGPTDLDTAIGNLLKELPGLFGGFWEVAYDLLIVWPLFLIVASLAAHGRKHLLRDLLLAIPISFVFAALAGLAAGTDLSASLDQVLASGSPPVYLGVRLAIATAVIATVSPHLVHPLRGLGRWLIGLGALAGVALGVSVSIGAAAGFLVGLAGAATVHLIFGSPGGRLTLEEVSSALDEIGVATRDLFAAPLQSRGVQVWLGQARDGRPLLVKIFGRDARQGQLIASTWSSLRRRGETVRLGTTWQQAQNEAFVSLFAERGGVLVLPLVAAGIAVDGDALLVFNADGRTLASMRAEEIDDRAIEGLWRAFVRLGALGVAMGRVDGHGLFVRPDGSAAVGEFGDATVAADRAEILADKAQLLVTTALVVGQERAVAIAARTIGNAALEDALPYLQHAALDPEVWRAVKARDWDLEDLRVRAEQVTGSAPRELEQLRRVTWGSILKILVIGAVTYALLSAVADLGLGTILQEFQGASKGWLIAAIILCPLVQIPQAVSTLGATLRSMRFWPVLMLQYGIQFIALAVPSSAARVALEIRFFERVGVPAAGAVSIGMIDSFSTFCIQLLLILVISLSGLASLDLSGSGSSSGSSVDWEDLLIALGLLVVAFVAALLVPRFRNMIKRFVHGLREKAADGRAALRVLRKPRKLLYLLGGNLIAQILLAFILGMCLQAFGYSATLAQLVLVNTFVSLFAGFMPVPGGVGVAEAGYTAGLIAIGIPHDTATSTALMFRFITFYLPPAWGTFAMRWMKEKRYL